MARVFFLCSGDSRILIMDLSAVTDMQESIKIIDECEKTIEKLPLKSVLLLTDVSNSRYDMLGIERLKMFSKNITPFILKSAAVGDIAEKNMIIEILQKISGRKIESFISRDEAVRYLTSF
ncbi:MAG: hypothetical protein PHW02_06030 [bacterium]|nr:hypothetical protein [bacterium]